MSSAETAGFSAITRVNVSGITIEWDVRHGTCSFEGLPVAIMWVDTTLAGLMAGLRAMVGTDRFALALQSEGRRSVESDWQVISQFPTFEAGFAAIANIAAVAGWGLWRLTSFDQENKELRFQAEGSWEGQFQKALGECWGSGMLAGKLAGYASRLFSTNCWAEQTAFVAKGDPFDEFLVRPAELTIEKAVDDLLLSDRATSADMAVALKRLQDEVRDRERAQAEASASAARLRAVAEALPDLMMLLDEDGRYLEILTAASSLLYHPSHDLAGKTINEIFPPEPAAAFMDIIKRAISTGTVQSLEYDLPLAKGKTFFEGLVSPVTSLPSPKPFVVFIARDITKRKLAEEALRESERRARAWLSALPDMMFRLTRDGVFIDFQADPKDMYVEPGRVIGSHAEAVLPPEFVQSLREMIARTLQSRALQFFEYEMTVPVRGPRQYEARMVVSGPDEVTVMVRDITERKRAESEKAGLETRLIQAQKLESIGRLAGGVAHDFNNLLAVQLGYCELLSAKLPPDDPIAEGLAEIKACGEKAAALTRQLLAFSRRQVLQPADFDLNGLVAGIDRLLRRLIGEDIRLVTTTSPRPAIVKADIGQIEQVLVNLAANARDAMPKGGRLAIEVSTVEIDESLARELEGATAGPYVALAVSDTGSGMDDHTRRQIFEPFFTTKGRTEATGLGLATAYGIVRQSGGFIKVYSEVGLGTTFRIYLPQVVGSAEGRVAATVPPRGSGERILLVEDDASLRRLAEHLIGRLGYEVESAGSAEAALALVERGTRPHLVITDVVMPDKSGPVLIKQLRMLLPGVKVLYMSGYTDDAIVHHGALEPGVTFLQKPFTSQSLAQKIREALTADA